MTSSAIPTGHWSAKALVGAVLVAFVLSGCATANNAPKTTMGAAGGAAAGGLIAAAAGGGPAGIVGGVLLGGLLGGAIGNALDQRDREIAAQAYQNSLENSQTGSASTWQNPDSGNSGSITPTRTYEDASGQNCREFQQTVTVGGKREEAYGTACRQADGSWKIVQ
jgi:surface antigen